MVLVPLHAYGKGHLKIDLNRILASIQALTVQVLHFRYMSYTSSTGYWQVCGPSQYRCCVFGI